MKIDLRALAKRVRDRNYRFRKMTPAQQRVRIARDVIEHLETGKLIARQRTYFQTDDSAFSDRCTEAICGVQEARDADLALEFERMESCQVCGIGAAFVAAVLRADDISLGDIGGRPYDEKMRPYLREWFEPIQIAMIESAFELSDFSRDQPGALRAEKPITQCKQAVKFGEKYVVADERLRAIMENIVQHGGEFVP